MNDSHIDLTYAVCIGYKKLWPIRAKIKKCYFGPQFGVFNYSISAQLNTKKIFLLILYLVTIYHPFR